MRLLFCQKGSVHVIYPGFPAHLISCLDDFVSCSNYVESACSIKRGILIGQMVIIFYVWATLRIGLPKDTRLQSTE